MEAFGQFIIATLSRHLFTCLRVREMLPDLMQRQAIRCHENRGHPDRIRAGLNEAEKSSGAFGTRWKQARSPPPNLHSRSAWLHSPKNNLTKTAEDRALAELQSAAKPTEKAAKKFADFVRMQLTENGVRFKRQN